MANPDFKEDKYRGVFQWIHLDKPFVFNSMEGKSVPVEPNTLGAKYTISWLLSAEEGAEFEQKCIEHFNARKPEDKKIKTDFGAVHGLKKNDDGTWIVTASRKSMNKNGEIVKVTGVDISPTTLPVFDGYKRPLDDLNLWNGSRGTAKFSLYPASNPSTKKWGISINLLAVQIMEAVRGAEDDDFEMLEAPAEQDPFGLPPAAQTSAAGSDLNDEIPF